MKKKTLVVMLFSSWYYNRCRKLRCEEVSSSVVVGIEVHKNMWNVLRRAVNWGVGNSVVKKCCPQRRLVLKSKIVYGTTWRHAAIRFLSCEDGLFRRESKTNCGSSIHVFAR
jgi:hypothetical protein